jgi:hypothetical protein
MIEFHDPRGDSAVEEELYELRCDLAQKEGEGMTVGLLANGYPDSESFLFEVEGALKQILPKLSIKHWNKGNASIVASDQILNEIQESCQAAIAAYGH